MKGIKRMIKEGKIGFREALALSTLAIVTKVFYTNPSAIIKAGGTAAWYITLASAIISLVCFFLVYILLMRFPGQNLNEIFEEVFGKIIGKTLSLVFIGYFTFYAGANLREFVEMIKAYSLPYTQPSFIIITFLLPVAVITYLGLEILVRISYASFWFIIGTIVVILVLNYPQYRLDSIYPLGGYGLQNNVSIAVTRMSAYTEVIVLAFIVRSVNEIKMIKSLGAISLTIAVTSISLVIFCSILKFDYTMSTEHVSNLFELSRGIYFGRFFQRIEAIFLIVWVTTSIILVAAFFYMAVSIFCSAFNISDQKPLIIPFVLLTFIITLQYDNLPEQLEKGTNFQRQKSALIIYLIPLATLAASLIFKKKGAKGSNEK
jgi:spore germination protein KB